MTDLNLPEEVRAAIDAMTYEDLLRKWRFSDGQDPLFKGASGRYAGQVMRRMRNENPGLHAKASEAVGWGDLLKELDEELERRRQAPEA